MNFENMQTVPRRRYLGLVGAGFTALAGCQDDATEADATEVDGTEADATEAATNTATPTETPGSTATPTDEDDLSAAEESLANFDFEGEWFDSHCHWRESLPQFDDYEIEDFTPVQADHDVGATVLFMQADAFAAEYDQVVQDMAQDDVNYLPFLGMGNSMETVMNNHGDVLWGVGEIPFYEGTPQYGMSLEDSRIAMMIETAAANDLPIMMHPTMQQAPELAPTMDRHPGLTMLLHGNELHGSSELLDLLDDYDDVYYTVDVAPLTAPLMDRSSGPEEFVNKLDEQEQQILDDSVDSTVEMLNTAPDQVMWGTDIFNGWHVDPTAYSRMISFSETFAGELPAKHREPYKYENAVALFQS